MAAYPKISRGGGIFEKFSARGGIPKIPPTPYSRCLHNSMNEKRCFYIIFAHLEEQQGYAKARPMESDHFIIIIDFLHLDFI